MRQAVGALLIGGAFIAAPASAQRTITERSVAAHEAFLASDAIQGRGSATRDEAIAAAYVASEFQSYGLNAAPGMTGYLQKATIIREKLAGAPSLAIGGRTVTAPTLLVGFGKPVLGPLAITSDGDPAKLPAGPVVLVRAAELNLRALFAAATDKGIKLLLFPENEATRKLLGMIGGEPRLPAYLEGKAPKSGLNVLLVPEAVAAAASAGAPVSLSIPTKNERAETTNAIGYLKGGDAKGGTLLLTAHLDHLGVRKDGTIMHGADDDASGTTAVMELAQALSTGKRPRRSILFVCYGSEEIGEYGSTYFSEHPPVPLTNIIANLEFEMIGDQDPKLPKNTLMMTGFERSNLGPALERHGGKVTSDPYPDQRFFERSDNYALALQGVVAHTLSGWAVVPTYHQPTDTFENLNISFMTDTIRSLYAPIAWLANGGFVPRWKPGGRPEKRR